MAKGKHPYNNFDADTRKHPSSEPPFLEPLDVGACLLGLWLDVCRSRASK